MRIEIRLSASMYRRWHEDLVDRLRQLPDSEVVVRFVDDQPIRAYRRLASVLRLERWLHGLEPGGLGRGNLLPAPATTAAKADIVLDLTAAPEPGHWTVHYDGRPGEEAAVDALRAGRQPVVTVVDGAGEVRAQGRPGSEQPGLLATALADISAGVATLLVGAVAGKPFAAPVIGDPPDGTPRPFAVIAGRRVVGAAVRLAYRIGFRAPHWRVGWRFVEGPDVLTLGRLPDTGWQDLPDDGYHFYADPFPFEHEGETYLFVEDFDHRLDKAVISAVAWDDHGPRGVPQTILSHAVHLSYPCVLEDSGEIWMIPETSNAQTVELYRAVRFPWEWERHSVLLEGVEASDVTPFRHDGRWWLTAAVGFGGSLSDSLCLWSAPELWGPWTPHAHNPVLVDIASARPAGHVHVRDGRLLRPVQDCRAGYGAAMGVAEITRLDDDGFEQQVIAQLGPGESWAGSRLHTLNTAGGIETIDGSRLSPRFRRARTQG